MGTIRYYLYLQIKMFIRKLKDLGFDPVAGLILLFIVFIGFSFFLFYKTSYADYLYILVALGALSQLSERNRNDFLKSVFNHLTYLKLRLAENLLVTAPFIMFLLFKQLYISALILTVASSLLALVNIATSISTTIPTPFYHKPFEFTIGFRNTFSLFIFSYFLTYMSVSAGNFNLGGFALLLNFGVIISYFTKLENEYYIWVFNITPGRFLIQKIKTAILYSTILIFPVIIALGIFFNNNLEILLILILPGYIYLITVIMAKYSSYPHEVNLPQALLIGISLLFPPVLLVLIPFFYIQSTKRLKDILS